MQTASGTLTTAVTASERWPAQTLAVDWDNNGNFTDTNDDVSNKVESITIDRTLASDLPDNVSLLTGYASAELTVNLTGDPTDADKHGAWWWSPFNAASPIFGKRRRWRPVTAALGFITTAGTELLTTFTGRTRGLTVDAATRTATLTALDNAETMRGDVGLPLVVADDQRQVAPIKKPNLNGAWLIDYIARKCGYYATPPIRPGAVVVATMAGSAYPEVGSLNTAMNSVPLGAAPFLSTSGSAVTPKFIDALWGDQATYTLASSPAVSTNDGGNAFVQGWFYTSHSSTANRILWQLGNLFERQITLYITTAGVLTATVTRVDSGTLTGYSSGVTVANDAWVYIGFHVNFTSTTITFHWRVGATSATTTAATTSVTTALPLTVFKTSSGADGQVVSGSQTSVSGTEALQVSGQAYNTTAPPWDDGFVPTSIIMPSLNQLTASAPSIGPAWDLVAQIAAAEMGMVGFDEIGRFTFYNRNRWTTAPYTTSQRTISTESLKALSTEESTDQVRNRVRIIASPPTLRVPTWVWSAPQVYKIAASSSRTIWAKLDTPAINVSTSWRSQPNGGTGQSAYRGNQQRDGSGTTVTNLTFVTTVFAQAVKMVITNPNAFAVYLVNPTAVSSDPGSPALWLWGTPVDFADSAGADTPATGTQSTIISEALDATSIANHGEQLLEVSGNPFLQDLDSLDSLAAGLLAQLKDPKPVLRGLEIPADPRLQLADRVTCVEPSLGLSADFHLVGIHTTFDGSGVTQTIDVRAV